MHCHAAEKANLFLRNFNNPGETRLMKAREQHMEDNKHILHQIVLAVEFLAKQALSFRGRHDYGVDFSVEDTNRGNFIATLQLMAKGDSILLKYLLCAKGNAKYTSTTILNEVTHIYACKIRETLTEQLREGCLPFTIIADEATDPHSTRRFYLCA